MAPTCEYHERFSAPGDVLFIVTPPQNRSRQRRQGKPNAADRCNAAGQIRIIGGRWRGRRLPVADVAGLRPTGDRVRETLFNWLQNELAGSRCLDLFAGTGALGLEALSRYAAAVTFVEPEPRAFAHLCAAIDALNAKDVATLVASQAHGFLAQSSSVFDIVFVDPPFDLACQEETLSLLLDGHLRDSALVYVESPLSQPLQADWPSGLSVYREKVFGNVQARLLCHGTR